MTPTATGTAALFMKYLTQNDALSLKYFQDQGLLPVTQSALASPIIRRDSYASTWAWITQTSRLDEMAPYANAAISTVIGQFAQAAYLGSLSRPEQAAAQMVQGLNQTTQQ